MVTKDIMGVLMDFIAYCNKNSGFVSFLLSALTLLVSILAIIVSIHTARLPYKKKLLVAYGSYMPISTGLEGWYITATNIGNRDIIISRMGYLIGEIVYINNETINNNQVELTQGNIISKYYDIDEIINVVKENNIKKSVSIIAFVEDSEGKKYKKRIGKVRDFISK